MELSAYALQPLREDEEFILYRGRPTQAEASSVLLLAPALRHPALETLEKINHEYALRSELGTTWAVRPRDIGGPSGAATRLGLKRTTLIAKMKKLGISRPVGRVEVAGLNQKREPDRPWQPAPD